MLRVLVSSISSGVVRSVSSAWRCERFEMVGVFNVLGVDVDILFAPIQACV